MPELPEVEVLARYLRPLLTGMTIRGVFVGRPKSVRPTSVRTFKAALTGATFKRLSRRGKYLLFNLHSNSRGGRATSLDLLGHLGMTGRMFVAPKNEPVPKHAAVVLDLGRQQFIYEDTRYFGRMSLDLTPIKKLGPEPLDEAGCREEFVKSLRLSRQAIKVKLLDQRLVAGVGNIYASEALFRAGISPRRAANRLTSVQAVRLWRAICEVLAEAINGGSTVPLNFGAGKSDGLYYFGRSPGSVDYYEERLRVYDRAGKPCVNCGSPIKRIVQGARSTYYCPRCQMSR